MAKGFSKERIGEIMKALLFELNKLGGEARPKELYQIAETKLNLTSFEREVFEKSGKPRWRLFATFYSIGCVKAGFIVKKNRKWYLTEEGLKALNLNPLNLAEEIDERYAKWRESHPKVKKEDNQRNKINKSQDIFAPTRSRKDTTYGEIINFRGLLHGPVNEQGVVFLFGMIAKELGFIVEAVKQGFPDCEAKWYISKKPARLQRVRIEFEYSSSNFFKHKHDSEQCDLIVCWNHDWEDCPLEVIELKSVIKELPNKI